MNVISKPHLLELAAKHPNALPAATDWLKMAKKADWKSLQEIRNMLPSTDQVGSLLIFNIKGNSYRLIVRVGYVSQRLYIKDFLTHAEYDKKEWMKWL